jgi:Flp pilus assembly protein TadD
MGSVPRKAVIYLIGVLLFAAVVRIYLPTTEHGYVFDDYQYLVENARVHSGLTGSGIGWAFTTTYASNWHPVTWLSHMLDVTIYGPRAAGHHLTNVLLHALATVLLFAALLKMTGAVWPSAFVAAMFGLHPLHVESVAWAAERKDVLSGVFWMLTMLAYAVYTRKPGALRYALVVLAFALGLMSKPMVLSLPLVLLLLDYWPLRRGQGTPAMQNAECGMQNGATSGPSPLSTLHSPLLLEKLPLLAMSAASAVVTIYAQQSTGAVAGAASLPFGMRAANAGVAYVAYARKMFWPSDLAVYYPHQLHSLPVWQVAVSATALVTVTYLAVRFARRAPYLTVGWLWYLVTLVPVIGLVQVGKQAMADRYTYIPLIGLFIIAAWGIPALAAGVSGTEWSKAERNSRSTAPQVAVAILAMAAVALSAFQTHKQLRVWRDEVTLFTHALDVTGDNWMAHHGLARALDQRGRTDAAIDHYRRSIAIDPTNADVHNGLATALLKRGRVDDALEEFSKAVRLDPDNAAARLHYGVALDRQNRLAQAVEQFRSAADLAPDNPIAHQNLAGALARQGDYGAAIDHYLIACRLTGFRDLTIVTNLAEAYHKAGRRAQAIETANRALNLTQAVNKPDLADYIRRRLQVYEER